MYILETYPVITRADYTLKKPSLTATFACFDQWSDKNRRKFTRLMTHIYGGKIYYVRRVSSLKKIHVGLDITSSYNM